MKKIIAAIFLTALFLTVSTRTSFAQTNMCNQRCDLDADCGSGYRCYVGVCRLDLCPAASSCTCASAVSTTPTATPKASNVPTATVKPTSTPRPTATPKTIATKSATLTQTPKTGASSWVMAGIAISLFLAGTIIAGADVVFASHGKSAQEIVAKRRSSRQ